MATLFTDPGSTPRTIRSTDSTITAGPFLNDGVFTQTRGTTSVKELDGVGAIEVNGGALTADRIRQSSLNLASTDGTPALVSVRSNGTNSRTSRLQVLSIDGGTDNWKSRLDLADNDLVLDPFFFDRNAVFADVVNMLKTARNSAGDFWSGNGIGTSAATPITGLGAIINEDASGQPIYTTFSGQDVDTGSILVKYTYYGDINLDGVVNIDDYFAVDIAFANHIDGGWHAGDFDYSGGPPNGDDYFLMDSAFSGQGAPAAGGIPSTVPEPCTATLTLLACTIVPRRRRR
jgi:hypothetical protein